MHFSLIVCTYMRPKPLLQLLNSVKEQTLYPNEILIIDGSVNDFTEEILASNKYDNLSYYKVDENNRGLTKQRNYGINLLNDETRIVCFLDDDIVLKPNYFERLLETYEKYPKALAAGGYIVNEVNWEESDNQNSRGKFYFDGWMRNEPLRFKVRNIVGLQPNTPPGFLPNFAHGRSIGFLPPSGRTYQVEQLMGGVSSYKKEVFSLQEFSPFFEGYGLYEDADFTLRLAKKGKLYVNTEAQLYHYHAEGGRPNKFTYGKMIIRNGWYVWRIKTKQPSLKSRIKWNLTAMLLIVVRFSNVFTTNKKKEAFTEVLGRLVGLIQLLFNKPKVIL